jgi:hypothetical protein
MLRIKMGTHRFTTVLVKEVIDSTSAKIFKDQFVLDPSDGFHAA